ncbi:hypothetical protein [Arthrobacter rhombi]|uniref:Uncharacterized protein n=1 Tax=Arthrobacter rhombi TaxID=71253 RepID=A0A1R4FWX8_9MICC|nr:hypothetical protein [Arthrobacter rhombi]SJM60351.1 hypothetical protein FM101_06225 [Arthrobacter rhombi]
MKKLRLYRQQWDAAGSGDAQSINNAMGRTSLDMWSVLLRETLQNSWDARILEQIQFEISEFTLSDSQMSVVTDLVFAELPPEGKSTKIRRLSMLNRFRVLTITDTCTRGLGGPIRANVAPGEGERSDFADFIRNFGRSHLKGLEGGTYGLGKGALYSASEVGVCIVYSQPRVNGVVEPRLIAVSGGDSDYVEDGYKFTGRNWWGEIASDDVVDPVLGDEARQLAIALGIPVMEPDMTGTSIMILVPLEYTELEEQAPAASRIDALREAALLWAWPHAIETDAGPNVSFVFKSDDSELAPIRPFEDPRTKHFAHAFQALDKWSQGKFGPPNGLSFGKEIWSKNPKQQLGHLVVRRTPESGSSITAGYANTVALMRKPRMIVKYMPVAPIDADGDAYGVFLADPEVDGEFAKAEPVTHDDWVASMSHVARRANFVSLALRRVRETFTATSAVASDTTGASNTHGASRISASLGSLIGSFAGNSVRSFGQAAERDSTSKSSLSRRVSIQQVRSPRLHQIQGIVHVGFTYAIRGGKRGDCVELLASARVVVAGGGIERDEGPAAAVAPEFAGWRYGKERELRSTLIMETPDDTEVTAVFVQPRETALRASVELREVRL